MDSKPIKLIVICIGVLSAMAFIGGFLLMFFDKKGGELMLSGATTGLGGMIALLSSTRSQSTPVGDLGTRANPLVSQIDTARGPVPVTPVENNNDKTNPAVGNGDVA